MTRRSGLRRQRLVAAAVVAGISLCLIFRALIPSSAKPHPIPYRALKADGSSLVQAQETTVSGSNHDAETQQQQPRHELAATVSSGLYQLAASNEQRIHSDLSHTGLSQQNSSQDGVQKERLLLFIGVLSGRGYKHRRVAVREAWSAASHVPGVIVTRFILTKDERTPAVGKENEKHGDMVFMGARLDYRGILQKTFLMLQYAVTTYDVAFILKTDDDAFVNPPWLAHQLRSMCESPGCRKERLYVGRMATGAKVVLRTGHKWADLVFWNHTGLRTYGNYMMGGGYVVSGDAAALVVDMHNRVGLKFTPIEDAALGMWLMAMDIRHISHRRFWTWSDSCCFLQPKGRHDKGAGANDTVGSALSKRNADHFELNPKTQRLICSDNPWLVLHKIDSPAKMRHLGRKFAKCAKPPELLSMDA